MKSQFLKQCGNTVVASIVFVLIIAFIFTYIPPGLLVTDTIPTGGDTAAHYYPAWYATEHIFSQFHIVGWAPGWYAGFPLFVFYFPLPFLLIAALAGLFSLPVAFKITTFLAIIAIPFAAYAFMRLLRFSKQISAIGAIFTLPFLFMEAYSAWGGNILSTFAGEFAYAFGLALSLVYLGLLYRGINERKHLLRNAVLLAVIGLTHVYALLWVVFSSLFVLFTQDYKKRFVYWFQVNAIAGLLLSFWMVPLVYYLNYTSTFSFSWVIGQLKEVFPTLLWPFAVLAVLGIALGSIRKDKKVLYLFFTAVIGTLFYFLAVPIGVVDVRFIPFTQLVLLLIAAYPFTVLFETKIRGLRLVPLLVLLLTVLWVQPHINHVPQWAEWNYGGFESRRLWEPYSAVQDFLKGNVSDPRVVYEHSPRHNAAGTIRAFEMLPYFSGRSTLEGLYLQSSPTAPFMFYIQSEVSEVASCPFPPKPCTAFNLSRGARHLELFNVKHYITITDEVQLAARNHSSYKLVFERAPYDVFELVSNESSYVVVPKYKPVVFPRTDWQNRSYVLFKDYYDVPVVFDSSVNKEPPIVRERLNANCTVVSELRNEEVLFTTNCVGQPHLVKVSYFPRWKSEHGEKIYLVSPSFMLIYPEHEKTRLYFGRTWVENASLALSLLGWIILITYYPLMRRWKRAQKPFFAWLRARFSLQKSGERY